MRKGQSGSCIRSFEIERALLGIWFMMFPDNIVVSSSGVEKSKFCLTILVSYTLYRQIGNQVPNYAASCPPKKGSIINTAEKTQKLAKLILFWWTVFSIRINDLRDLTLLVGYTGAKIYRRVRKVVKSDC